MNCEVSPLILLGAYERLLSIHNMCQGCRYCNLWADGLNGILQHLECAMSVALLSKDTPRIRRDLATTRNRRFRLAPHGGGDCIREQTAMAEVNIMPGVVVYERKGEKVYRKTSASSVQGMSTAPSGICLLSLASAAANGCRSTATGHVWLRLTEVENTSLSEAWQFAALKGETQSCASLPLRSRLAACVLSRFAESGDE
ncbi:MAG: hypothetical protein OXI87_07925 [Albidovulum sp.]|nr:hypothetical protein [Albidovulum sp.]MDE0534580.1 hypothetical protein [Albidovulum sp.]